MAEAVRGEGARERCALLLEHAMLDAGRHAARGGASRWPTRVLPRDRIRQVLSRSDTVAPLHSQAALHRASMERRCRWSSAASMRRVEVRGMGEEAGLARRLVRLAMRGCVGARGYEGGREVLEPLRAGVERCRFPALRRCTCCTLHHGYSCHGHGTHRRARAPGQHALRGPSTEKKRDWLSTARCQGDASLHLKRIQRHETPFHPSPGSVPDDSDSRVAS